MIVGENKRGMPSERAGILDYRVVLVQGDDNDVAAYIGHGSQDWVGQNGDKLSEKEANIHFPGLSDTLRKRGMGYRL